MGRIELKPRSYILRYTVEHPGDTQEHHGGIVVEHVDPVRASCCSQIQQAALGQQKHMRITNFKALNMNLHALLWLVVKPVNINFSLSDLADTGQAVEVGQLTSARILLAGSVTESGSSFLLNGRLGGDIPFSGIPRSDTFEEFPFLLHTGVGVSYRPWRFLQIAASMNVTWTEFQYGEFDPEDPEYGNTPWLITYYGIGGLSDSSLPSLGLS